ncbi:MAG TPA: energy transducer TonB [Blastocatellia bacterium]|nr:energy transducer TonB [Blastocatellia bacterium]
MNCFRREILGGLFSLAVTPRHSMPAAFGLQQNANDWWTEAKALGAKAAQLKKARYQANAELRSRISKQAGQELRSGKKTWTEAYEELNQKAEPEFAAIRQKYDAPIATAMSEFVTFLRAGAASPESINTATGTVRPTILYQEKANYTEAARQSRVQGTVLLSMVFSADGQITNIRVVRGLPDGLDDEAMKAARELVFLPAVKDGKPVSVRMSVEYSFSLI